MACYKEIQARNVKTDISDRFTLRLYRHYSFIHIFHSEHIYDYIIVTSVFKETFQ